MLSTTPEGAGEVLSNNTVSDAIGALAEDQLPGVDQLVVPALPFQVFWAWADPQASTTQANMTRAMGLGVRAGQDLTGDLRWANAVSGAGFVEFMVGIS
jgi:hypothetical protein